MSKIDITTQDLLRQLGPTTRSRSTKADALFRRLRFEQSGQVADALSRAPKAVKASEIAGNAEQNTVARPPE